MAEGYIEHKEGRFFYIYQYTDHLGNIRLSYTYDENVGMIRIMEENHYYQLPPAPARTMSLI